MKRIFTKELFDSLLQIIAIFLVAAFLLGMLESCEAEKVNRKDKAEKKALLPLHALNVAGDDDLHIVFLPEGYTDQQMGDFVKEVNVAWGILQETKPYSHSLDRINVYYSTALASATDSLGSGHTAFALGTPKPLQAGCEISHDSILSTAKKLPFAIEKTVLVIMVNVGGDIQIGFTQLVSPQYEKYYPKTVVIRSLFDRYPAAFTHELGHAVGHLADCYSYQGENFVFDEKEREELLEWQQYGFYLNVSTTANEDEVFWSQFITDEAFAAEHIGIYKGGYTFPEGVYRPTYNSVMRHHFQSDFYSGVERYLIYRRIEQMHSGRDISYEEWRAIDLAHPQAPINWHSLTGSVTRSTINAPANEPVLTESDVIILR